MRKKLFSKSQMKALEKNSNVIRVTEQAITYNPEFKVKAVRESLTGKTPVQIFVEHGFDSDVIGKDIPRKRLYQWRQIYNESGELGLSIETRAKVKPNDHPQRSYPLRKNSKKLRRKLNF